MRRRLARPFGHTLPPARILSLMFGLAVLALFYQRVKEPQFWHWMTNESRADVADDSTKESPPPDKAKPASNTTAAEEIIPGPNESDPDELAKLRSNLKAVQDRQPLQPHEMSAYWRLLGWSRTRPLAELEKGALRDVPYSHLWEEPDLYRGQLMRLRLHVRRVTEFDAKENSLGVKKVYEVIGWNDNSLSFPFIVVIPEKPAGLPIGTDVDGEIVFVGYFLKWMSYRAFDAKKNAPLLIGRARPVVRGGGSAKSSGWETAFLTLIGGIVVLSLLGWFGLSSLRRPRSALSAVNAVAPERLPDNWMSDSPTEPSIGFAPTVANVGDVVPNATTEVPVANPATPSASTSTS